jgi:hypothetical protein
MAFHTRAPAQRTGRTIVFLTLAPVQRSARVMAFHIAAPVQRSGMTMAFLSQLVPLRALLTQGESQSSWWITFVKILRSRGLFPNDPRAIT